MSSAPFVNNLGSCNAQTLGDLVSANEVINVNLLPHRTQSRKSLPEGCGCSYSTLLFEYEHTQQGSENNRKP